MVQRFKYREVILTKGSALRSDLNWSISYTPFSPVDSNRVIKGEGTFIEGVCNYEF
jgi:hypothetical protein